MMGNRSFEKAVNEYIGDCRRRAFAGRTVVRYRYALDKFYQFLDEHYPAVDTVGEVTRRMLCEYQKQISEQKYKRGKKERKLAISTQFDRMLVVLLFFHFLTAREEILSDPATAIQLPRVARRLPRNYLSIAEMRKLLATCDLSTHIGLRNRTMLEILYSAGIRNAEIRGLKLCDINLADGLLTIRQGKGRKDRVVPIGKAAVYFLTGYLNASRSALLAGKDHEYAFVNRFGAPLSEHGLLAMVRFAGADAGIKRRITPHAIRHTCATQMLRGRADIRWIQELLGHASLSSTQIYTRVEITDLKKVHARCHPREKEPIERK